MTKEEKHLLSIDIAARLPYGIWFQSYHSEGGIEGKGTFNYYVDANSEDAAGAITVIYPNCKPYLRPLKSMTADERQELYAIVLKYVDGKDDSEESPSEWSLYDNTGIWNVMGGARFYFDEMSYVYDWLIEHHFDFRGLIEKGLALPATEDMYKQQIMKS